jgi:hypothetical protein
MDRTIPTSEVRTIKEEDIITDEDQSNESSETDDDSDSEPFWAL